MSEYLVSSNEHHIQLKPLKSVGKLNFHTIRYFNFVKKSTTGNSRIKNHC